MHPEFFTLPVLGTPIKTYGFCLMIGFLSAVWFSMRRARRVKADADVVLDMSFLSLLFGVAGARVFYVVHYWESHFADAPNRLLAAINITEGGLEFLGGLLCAFAAILVYAVRKKLSIRLYLDIMAPGVMWGLAFGRLGCFFNGCCFGALCVGPPAQQEAYPWGVRFPFASNAHLDQWAERKVTAPAELVVTAKELLRTDLLPSRLLAMSVEKRERPNRRYQDLREQYQRALLAAPDAEATDELQAAVASAQKKKNSHESELAALRAAQRYPSRRVPARRTSVSELEELAATYRSLSVHPAQLYSAIHAMLLSGVLSLLFYLRKRHGVVIGALFMLYPIPRGILEMIRGDNPHDVLGLTISQFVSLAMLGAGLVYLVILYKRMPQRSPVLDQRMANGE